MQLSPMLRAGALAAALLTGLANTASASTATWVQNHPRRAEVNHRLAHQDHRINRELRKGEISQAQARDLHRQDHIVRHEERVMAAHDHGHITGADQRSLNQQENGVSRDIGR